jgi:hypothetical protein
VDVGEGGDPSQSSDPRPRAGSLRA